MRINRRKPTPWLYDKKTGIAREKGRIQSCFFVSNRKLFR
nr:MAG TPA: hypothetical protein [Caudoviricetes sp.]